MDHMRISATEPSPVVFSQTKYTEQNKIVSTFVITTISLFETKCSIHLV